MIQPHIPRGPRENRAVPLSFAQKGDPWHRGLTNDVSVAGLCVASSVTYPRGTLLALALSGADGLTSHAAARVAWVHPPERLLRREGRFGVRFVALAEPFLSLLGFRPGEIPYGPVQARTAVKRP